ncbi:hypothetical protein SMICM304S_01514 [Streptomyces microflavus]
MIAQLRQGQAYDPAKQTLSVLASYGATSYWLMTGMLLMLGACYVVTAHALRAAAFAGRVALAGGGLCALALTLVPVPRGGGALEHGAVATLGLVLLAVWPCLAAVRGAGAGSVGAAAGCVAHRERIDGRVALSFRAADAWSASSSRASNGIFVLRSWAFLTCEYRLAVLTPSCRASAEGVTCSKPISSASWPLPSPRAPQPVLPWP